MPDANDVLEWRGQTAVDPAGDKIGKIEEIYLDAETERPEWALVQLGRFSGKSAFMPLQGVSHDGGDLRAPYTKDQVESAPGASADGELSQQEEAALYSHYGIDYGEARSDSGLPEGDASRADTEGDDVSGRETDDAMTRSQEELRVGTTQRETGRARLRKYIVTEHVTKTVPVRREEIRVEREPITEGNAGAAMGGADLTEEEHEVTLHEEEVVVEKRVVPKERVRMGKETIAEEREVAEQVRSEQIEVIDAAGEPAEGRDGVRGTDDGIGRSS
jgi:uncharacterized protein (TIGR02271 family)